MSETWLKNEFSESLIHIPGYSLYRLDRSWSEGKDRVKKGGGLAMYIKSNISHSDAEFKLPDESFKMKPLSKLITVHHPHSVALY